MTRAVITVTGTSTDARGFPTVGKVVFTPSQTVYVNGQEVVPTLIFWSNIGVY